MSNDPTTPKPSIPQTTRDEGLDGAACSRLSDMTKERDEYRQLAVEAVKDLQAIRKKYGIGDRHVMRELCEALEAADECLALIEDVGHGAMMDNVTVARQIVQSAISFANV